MGVRPAGPPQVTPSSELLPGMRDGRAVMLKIARLRSISRQAQLASDVLAGWTIAWCGLTLTWGREDPAPSAYARAARAVAERLLADRSGEPPARRRMLNDRP
jgi:streptomycin 6-kinase